MRAVNSSTGMKRAMSIARYIWLTRTVLAAEADAADLVGHGAAAEHGAQDLDHHGQAAALVSAERHQHALVRLLVSVVGTPSESKAQPAGNLRLAVEERLEDLACRDGGGGHIEQPGPGTDMQIGLVPSRPSLPCQGGTIGEALHITMPIWPASRIFCAHQAAAPKWFDSLATTSPIPCARAIRMAWPQQVSATHWPSPFCPSKCRHAAEFGEDAPSVSGSISPARNWSM